MFISNVCTHFADQLRVVTAWEVLAAVFRKGLSLGLQVGGNIPISISASSEDSFFFSLAPDPLPVCSFCSLRVDTWSTNTVSEYYLPN
jgi:hypothetical protein